MKVLHVAETLKGGLETYLRIVSNFQRNSPEISQVKFILPGNVDWLNPESAHVVPTARSPLSLPPAAARSTGCSSGKLRNALLTPMPSL